MLVIIIYTVTTNQLMVAIIKVASGFCGVHGTLNSILLVANLIGLPQVIPMCGNVQLPCRNMGF